MALEANLSSWEAGDRTLRYRCHQYSLLPRSAAHLGKYITVVSCRDAPLPPMPPFPWSRRGHERRPEPLDCPAMQLRGVRCLPVASAPWAAKRLRASATK